MKYKSWNDFQRHGHEQWSLPSRSPFAINAHPLLSPDAPKVVRKAAAKHSTRDTTEISRLQHLKEFHAFSKLPVELQIRIFELSVTPRALYLNEGMRLISSSALPPTLLQVNRLARSTAQGLYCLIALPMCNCETLKYNYKKYHIGDPDKISHSGRCPPILSSRRQIIYFHTQPYFDSISMFQDDHGDPGNWSIHPRVIKSSAKPARQQGGLASAHIWNTVMRQLPPFWLSHVLEVLEAEEVEIDATIQEELVQDASED